MYQRQSEPNEKAASLEGMEAVFDKHRLHVDADKPGMVSYVEPPPLVGPRRVLRGSYSKGLLVLKEDEHAVVQAPWSSDALQSEPSLDYYGDNRLSETTVAYTSEVNQANLVLLELVRIHALQAKAANDLIVKLSERLKKSDEFIQMLLGHNTSSNVFGRLFMWLARWDWR